MSVANSNITKTQDTKMPLTASSCSVDKVEKWPLYAATDETNYSQHLQKPKVGTVIAGIVEGGYE